MQQHLDEAHQKLQETLAKASQGLQCSKETTGLLDLIQKVQSAGKGKRTRPQSESGGEQSDCDEGGCETCRDEGIECRGRQVRQKLQACDNCRKKKQRCRGTLKNPSKKSRMDTVAIERKFNVLEERFNALESGLTRLQESVGRLTAEVERNRKAEERKSGPMKGLRSGEGLKKPPFK
ncbi:hypothetical protein AX14_007821 [Amanita brunnescens Koide BX004]|nr:hypothetical protein AX14_007821 [Amanita brunnescens Koide BX004]